MLFINLCAIKKISNIKNVMFCILYTYRHFDLVNIYVYIVLSKPNPPKTDLHHP